MAFITIGADAAREEQGKPRLSGLGKLAVGAVLAVGGIMALRDLGDSSGPQHAYSRWPAGTGPGAERSTARLPVETMAEVVHQRRT